MIVVGAITCVMAIATGPEATSGRGEPLPKELEGVGIDEKLESQVPKGLGFKDETGRSVTLGHYFDTQLPTILTLNYSDCPMLCSLQLNGLVDGLKEMELTAGKEFRIITISLDPSETPEKAMATKERYISQYGRPQAASGWHFLTGSEENIRAVAESVGFSYRYSTERKEYLHAAAVMLLTPEGKVSRYLYGLVYQPKTLRLSILESGEGKFASVMDQLILYCFHYDAEAGRYAPVAFRVMQVGGAMTVTVLGGVLGIFWMRESRRRRSRVDEDGVT